MSDRDQRSGKQWTARDTAVAYGRGAAGGLLIALPLLLTMEMWWGGFTISGWRLLALLAVNFGVLLVLQHYSGLHPRKTRGSQIRSALIAYGIGVIVSIVVLEAINVLRGGVALVDVVGKLVLEAVPVSLGASLAMSHFGVEHDTVEQRKDERSFWAPRAMALAGAMIFGMSLAATEEMPMIGLQLSWAHALGIAILSLVQVYAIVYAVDVKNHETEGATRPSHRHLIIETVGVYAIAVSLSSYLLWTFGHIGAETGLHASADIVVTLGFATSLGAAAAELLI